MNEKNPLIGSAEESLSSLETQQPTAKSTPTIDLPNDYGSNKLVLLPVNAHAQHFYWEIACRDLQAKMINRFAKFEVRLYILDGNKRALEDTIEILNARGNHYTYSTPNLKKVQAVLVMIDKKGEKEILFSNVITAPSSGFHASPWEIWMTKNGEQQTYESKQSIDQPSGELVTSPSSLDLVIKDENIRARMGDFALGAPSSDFASNQLFGSFDSHKGKK